MPYIVGGFGLAIILAMVFCLCKVADDGYIDSENENEDENENNQPK